MYLFHRSGTVYRLHALVEPEWWRASPLQTTALFVAPWLAPRGNLHVRVFFRRRAWSCRRTEDPEAVPARRCYVLGYGRTVARCSFLRSMAEGCLVLQRRF